MKRILTLGLTIAMAIASAAGDAVDLTKPPATPPLAAFKLPPTVESTLPNGLKLVMVRDSRFPILTARLVFEAGSRFDPPTLPGLAETAGNLLKEGTVSRSSREIAERLASIGATLSVDVNADSLTLSFSGLSDRSGELFDTISDILRHASFPDDELALRKANRRQELLAERSQASTLVDERFHQAIFGAHPYAVTLPTADSIDRLARADLDAFRRRMLVPNNACLILVSPLAPKDLASSLSQRFAGWEKGATPALALPATPAPRRQIVLVDRPGSVQADIMVGRTAITRGDPDYFPLLVANTTLGTGASSRLFRNIREKEGFAYDAHSELRTLRNGAFAAAVTQVRNEVMEPALRGVLKELEDLASAPIPSGELDMARNLLSGVFSIRLETPDGIAAQLAMVKSMGLANDYLETYTTRIRNVTAAQAQAAASKYFAPANSAIVVVGDASKIGAALSRFGSVRIEKP